MKVRLKRVAVALPLAWPLMALGADKKSAGTFFPPFMEGEVSSSAIVLAPASFFTRGYGISHIVDSPWSVLGVGIGVTIQDFTFRLGVGTYPFMWTINTALAADWNFGDGKSGRISPFAGISYNHANHYQLLYQNSDDEFILETADFAFSMGYFLGVRFTGAEDRSYGFGLRHDPILYKSGPDKDNLGLASAYTIEHRDPRVPFKENWGFFGFIGWIFH